MPFGREWWDYRLAIGIAANHEKIEKSFMFDMMNIKKTKEYVVVHQGKHIKSDSLNRIAEHAAKENCDKLLFCDADMEFPFDTAKRLISHNMPIVSGLYHLKAFPYSPVAGWTLEREDGSVRRVNGRGMYWKHHYAPLPKNQLVEVDWVGIGCLLIDMDVFREAEFTEPCFRDDWDDQEGNRARGHDIRLCDILKDKGYKIYVDTAINCGHIGSLSVDRLWIEAFYKSNMRSKYKRLLEKEGDNRMSQKAWLENLVRGDEAKLEQANSKQYWDARHKLNDEMGIVTGDSRVVDLISQCIPKGESVADLGCGKSILLGELIKQKEVEPYAFDLSSEAIDFQMKEFGIPGETVDLLEYSPNGRKFHTVIAAHLIEHFSDKNADKAMRLIHDMTRVQAFVVVPQERPDKEFSWGREHARIYDERSLRMLIGKYFNQVGITKIEPEGKEKDKFIHRHLLAHCIK